MASDTPAMDALLSGDTTSDSSGPIANTPQGSNTPAMDSLLQNEQYSTPGQTALGIGEQLVKGAIGPGQALIEKGLTKIGVPGLSPQEQEAREQALPPAVGPLSEMTGFAGSMLLGGGLGKIIPEIGEAAAGAAGLGDVAKAAQAAAQAEKLGAPVIAAAIRPTVNARLAANGVKTGAEMAALAGSNEISKMINGDPNQTLGSAAINMGLSGLLGAGGGIALGAVSPLWSTAKNMIGAEKVANDFMGETQFLRENPDLAQGAANEVTTRMAEADQLLNGGLKGNVIAQVLPEATPENLGKIDAHLFDISNQGFKRIQDASDNAYLKGAVPKLQQDLNDFNEVITNPKSTIADKWDALDEYKRVSQGHANYNILTGGAEDKALSKWIKPFNAQLRLAAEDNDVWGKAGDVQRTVNKANSALFDAQKDFLAKATDKELGERVASPTKLQTLINTSESGKVGTRQNIVKNYLKATQDAADAINAVHINNGLEAPMESKLNSTPVLSHVLDTPITAGRSLAQWTQRKGTQALAHSMGEVGAGTVGGGFGSIIGHPLLGAWAGEKVLTPVFSALAKPFAEKAINSQAMKSSIDFAANSARGASLLNKAAGAFFKSGEIIPQNLMPEEKSRNKLKAHLDAMNDNPQVAMNVGGNIGHYMPDHAVAAGALASTTQNYFNSLKPTQLIKNPLDTKPPISAIQNAKYNRALDVAQQPLLVLQHAQKGSLQSQDIQTLNTLFPELRKEMVSKITENMMNHVNGGNSIPYHQRQSLSMLLGSPLDSTLTLPITQAVMRANASQQTSQAQGQQAQHKASGKELDQINKVNDLYNTPIEQRLSNKKA